MPGEKGASKYQRARRPIKSDIGWSDRDNIREALAKCSSRHSADSGRFAGMYGYDLPTELLGKVTLGDMAHLSCTGRLPKNENERKMFNALCVTLVEHGLTPSAIVARMTYIGWVLVYLLSVVAAFSLIRRSLPSSSAPEAMQAAIASGLSGLGSVFVGSTETSAKMVTDALPFDKAQQVREGKLKVDFKAMAKEIVKDYRARKAIVPGIGHPIHKPIDPRTPRLFQLAKETGYYGPYVELIQEISKAAEEASGKESGLLGW